MRVAGQFARITNSNTADSVNLLSSAINTFGLSSSDAERVAAQFFTTIDLGRVKTDELASTAGRIFETGKSLGVSLEEVNAALITITQSGIKTEVAQTLIQNVFQKLLNPTKELEGLYRKLGVSSGEGFVKTYGFAGAIRKLRDETGGSTAKLADFFNEIRGFQGIDNLVSRIDVFEKSLGELDNSLERTDKAKKLFENLPGQEYQEQVTKLKNFFLTGFNNEILNTVLGVSHAFGDLDKVIKTVIATSVSLGVSLAIAIAAAKVAELNAKLEATGGLLKYLGSGVQANALAAGFVVVGTAIGITIARLIEAYEAKKHLFDDLSDLYTDQAKEQQAAEEKRVSVAVDAAEKEFTRKKQVILDYVAFSRQQLNKIGDGLDKTNERLGENLKNSLELVVQSSCARRSRSWSTSSRVLSRAPATSRSGGEKSPTRPTTPSSSTGSTACKPGARRTTGGRSSRARSAATARGSSSRASRG